jgi:exopolyphosphatase/guanosine-5'-triphosphate,3'-diphosphate pyrophosphatase
VRRWFGWSAGRLLVLDIGGGSLEIAAIDETHRSRRPAARAGRLTEDQLADPPPAIEVEEMSAYADKQLAGVDIEAGGPGGRLLERSDLVAGRCPPPSSEGSGARMTRQVAPGAGLYRLHASEVCAGWTA